MLSELCETPVSAEQDKCQVFYDPCRASPGCIPTGSLQEDVQRLCATNSNHPQHTFIFSGKIAGIQCSVLWDSGAVGSFISREFVRRNKLATKRSSTAMQLANGSVVESSDSAKLKLRIQGHQSHVNLVVTDLLPGYDVILGDDWSRMNEVHARYGSCATANDLPSPPKLVLQKSKCELLPVTSHTGASGPAAQGPVLSACAAAKFLSHPKCGSASPFVVLTHRMDESVDTVSNTLDRNSRLQLLLSEYEDVFQAPSLKTSGASSLGDQTPECIPIIPGSVPCNRPLFRLSPKEKTEIEQQVKTALDNGWIEQWRSAYGAPVLFVPKPDGSLRMPLVSLTFA